MKTTDKPRQNPETAGRVIDGKTFVLHAETTELHTFSDVGARIWELSDGSHSVAEIVSVIEDEYEVDGQRAEDDAVEFLDELLAKGLVTLS